MVKPGIAFLIVPPDEALRPNACCPRPECRVTDNLLCRAYDSGARMGRLGNSLSSDAGPVLLFGVCFPYSATASQTSQVGTKVTRWGPEPPAPFGLHNLVGVPLGLSEAKGPADETLGPAKTRTILPSPAEGPLYAFQPGKMWVLIKDLRGKHWKSKQWQGPFQILLITHTAV
ncbi:hypothetical protein GOODEAATRI_027215 [Goodea atripinnis]|uniref:Murine leukemia virus integrase C-terminal domain-containing protein n=1 Tax=Goodea atripinnis TaxID=208336 RepID=A0ABV0P870_9TELE